MSQVNGAYDVLDELYTAFKMMDTDGSNQIDYGELHKNFQRQLGGKKVPKSWIERAIINNDVTHDNQLSFAEFCKMETEVYDPRLDAVKEEFETFQTTAAGIVTSRMLVDTYMERAKAEKKEAEVEAAFKAAGMLEADSEVTFSTFFKLSTGMPIKQPGPDASKGSRRKSKNPSGLHKQWTEQEIRDEFQKLDKHDTGKLTRKQIKHGMKDLEIVIPMPELNRILVDGHMDYEEFRKVVVDHGGLVQSEPVMAEAPIVSLRSVVPNESSDGPKTNKPESRRESVYLHNKPTDESTLGRMIEAGIYEMRNFNATELADFLEAHCGERFELFRAEFVKHGITGNMFRYLNEKHLEEMCPYTVIGDRLYMMNVRHKVARAERIARRQHVILQGRGFVSPPGVWATYVLTNESMKVTFVDATKNRDESNPFKVKSHICKKIDHIDLITVTDVDIETTEDTEATYQEVAVPVKNTRRRSSRFSKKKTRTEVVRHVSEMNTAKLHLKIENKEDLSLIIPSAEAGRNLHNKLVDAIEEVQHLHSVTVA